MKAIILNGFKKENGKMARIHDLMLEELKNLNWDATSINLEDKNIAYCLGCFGCWVQTPGECVIKDHEAEIVKQLVQSDLVIYFTPITFGGYSSILKKALDRQISRVLPYFTKVNGEIHHIQRYEKLQSLIGVGILENPDNEKREVFKTLIYRNSLNGASPYHQAIIYEEGQDPLEFSNDFNKTLMEIEVVS
jgi:multimeric flavodoxin WrbA